MRVPALRPALRRLAWLAWLAASACGRDADTSSLTRAQLLDPASCAGCHPDHFRDWSTSVHAHAADDPVFLAMNARGQRETGGALGDFCVRCHAPMALREGATRDGLNLAQVPQALKGVTCFFCHSADAVHGDANAPVDLADDGVLRGPLADPLADPAHGSAYSPLVDRVQLASASLCGSCHDVVTPAGTHLERTYAEWRASPFADDAACGRCHMDAASERGPIAGVAGAPPRVYHGHSFPAVDHAPGAGERDVQARLDRATRSALCVVQHEGGAEVRVVLATVGVGHAFPSGAAQDRRLWTEVEAHANNEVVFRSGEADADTWLLGTRLRDGQGEPTHMFWDAASVEGQVLLPGEPATRRFPADASLTIPGVLERVTLRLRLRPIGHDVLDDLVRSGDLDPGAAQEASSTVDLDLGAGDVLEWTPEAARVVDFADDGAPVACVSATNLTPP